MRKLLAGIMVVAAMAIISGCGSSNSKLSYSAFSNAAGKICTGVNAQSKAAGSLTTTANAANAATLTKVISISNKALTKLKALQGPSALESARDTFAGDITAQTTLFQKAATAAKAGNQAEYVADAKSASAANQTTNTDASKLGAPSCATS